MIYNFLKFLHRHRRYREVSNLIIGIITAESQKRLDKTLSDAYTKARAQGAKEEDLKAFNQKLVDDANAFLAKENGIRVRQWTDSILDAEEK
jgi:hypothetical protein